MLVRRQWDIAFAEPDTAAREVRLGTAVEIADGHSCRAVVVVLAARRRGWAARTVAARRVAARRRT